MIFKNEIIAMLSQHTGLADVDWESMLEVPPESKMGDWALACFKLSKALRKSPVAIADSLKDELPRPAFIARMESEKGYLNFFIDPAALAREALAPVLREGERYGASAMGQGKTVCIDYSSINIAKRFHLGHLSTTALGHALYRIYGFLGYNVVGINHLGDWGTQFGKLISAYKRWGDRKAVEEGGVDEMTRLYVRFHDEAERDPALEEEGRFWFKKIEENDPEAMDLFVWFKEVTLRDAQRVYGLLGITFDSYAGESFYNDKMDRVIDELTQEGLLKDSDGAKVVDLEDDGMPPCLIVKSDGATLYATRDIAAALYRKDTYAFDKCLYVVAYQQNLHFRQFFKVIEKMGYAWAKDMEHVSFGMVSYEGQALSTRKGHVLYLDELLEKAVEKAQVIIEEKNPDLDQKDTVAREVGIGSVLFAALFNNRIKDIDFWWERALNFDGETGPYVQYTHARCRSLLRRAEQEGVALSNEPNYACLTDPAAQAVLKLLAGFPGVAAMAAERNEPYLVARYTVSLAQAFNRFYLEQRIVNAPAEEAGARLCLVKAVSQVLKTGLWLIGVEAPKQM